LLSKYADRQPALVFALSDIALDFLVKYRAQLWPFSPVVFTNLSPDYFDTRRRPEWVTGIVDQEDFSPTVELALKLQPDARRILIVGGVGFRDVTTNAKATRDLEALLPSYRIEVRAGVPIADFPREFGKLRQDTILLYTMMFRDSEGRAIVPRDAVKALAAKASVPVYGFHSTFLGLGVIGVLMIV